MTLSPPRLQSAPAPLTRIPVLRFLRCSVALLGAGPTWASSDLNDYKTGVEFSFGLGITINDDDIDEELTAVGFGVHRWLSPKWGAEISYSVTDEGVFNESNRFLDLSALYRLTHNSRYSTLVFGGIGTVDYQFVRFSNFETDDSYVDIQRDDSATLHLGIAFQVRLGQRFYMRPELRARRYLDVNEFTYDDTAFDSTLGFGMRF